MTGRYSSEVPFGRVVFASDVSKSSGAGHIMRLIEIANALPTSVEKVFFGEVRIAWVEEIIKQTFHKFDDSRQDSTLCDLIILDSYEELFCLRVKKKFPFPPIVQIADRYAFLLPNSQLIFMDLPFLYPDLSIKSRVAAHGIEFLPTRNLLRHEPRFRKKAQRVLVTTGGSINEKIYSQLVEELSNELYRDIKFEFIGGNETFSSNRTNFEFHSFGSNFDAIAQDCDTAISTSGTTMWNLLANEVIIGVVASVENQLANYDYVTQNGQALSLFDFETLNLDVLALRSLLFDTNIRQSLYNKLSGKYDFGGAKRVVDIVLKNN